MAQLEGLVGKKVLKYYKKRKRRSVTNQSALSGQAAVILTRPHCVAWCCVVPVLQGMLPRPLPRLLLGTRLLSAWCCLPTVCYSAPALT